MGVGAPFPLVRCAAVAFVWLVVGAVDDEVEAAAASVLSLNAGENARNPVDADGAAALDGAAR